LDKTEIIEIIISTINSIFEKLFSSIDNNIYSSLDNFVFINGDIVNNSFIQKLLGSNGKSGIIYLADALLLGVIIYYSVRLSFSTFSGHTVEKPSIFILKMIVLGIFINFSYFFAEQTLNLNELISNSIKEIGKTVLNKEISFSNIIKELNSVISIGSSSFDIFSLDGIIKGFISTGLLNLLLTYSLRYVMVQVFILLTPLSILTLINSSTSWIFKSWLKALFSLLLLQSLVSIILIIMLSFDSSSKILLIGSIYALIRSNSYLKELLGGISIDISNNFTNFKKGG